MEKEETYRFNLNLPVKLMEKVRKVATRDHRSVTQQIICALEHMTSEVKDDESTVDVQ